MIEVKGLNKTYGRKLGDHRVLKDVSFTLPDTGFVCILGPSGCGKTSLLNAIGGLDRFDRGHLRAEDTVVTRYGTSAYEKQRNRNFGYIFQNYYLLEDHSVAYNIYIGLHSLKLSHKEKLQRVRMALQAVDMERYIRRRVRDLSGGQQQRVAIARALARRPRVIFADEPTGNLDEANTRNICTLLRQASKESLVIMVTHEESIANFFADRIIRLDQGRIVSDVVDWQRDSLALYSDKEVYTGDLNQVNLNNPKVRLRLLNTDDASPVELTVIAAKDRIILKLSDSRGITLAGEKDPPVIIEGPRPPMTREAMDETSAQAQLFALPPAPQCRAGRGVSLPMMLREAKSLLQGKGLKKAGLRIFLMLLTLLTLLTLSDYISISRINPQDFVTTDSHILKVTVQTGEKAQTGPTPDGTYSWLQYNTRQFFQDIATSDIDMDLLPVVDDQPKFTIDLFYQMKNASQRLPACGYAYIDRLDESTLLCGRMPKTSEEVVVDRIIIDAVLKEDGILQNSITDYSSILGETLSFTLGVSPRIVGICDSGERTIYAKPTTLLSIGGGGIAITVSELRSRFPGQYEQIDMLLPDDTQQSFALADLTIDGCIVNTAEAGTIWEYRMGLSYGSGIAEKTVKAFFSNRELLARVIVADEAPEGMMLGSYKQTISIWCADKEQMKEFLADHPLVKQGRIKLVIADIYGDMYAEYKEAATVQADGRTIVTASILVLSMVMLYLLCRTRVSERLGLVAVYRLLGIPGRKLRRIFLREGTMSSLMTIVPTAGFTWLIIEVINRIPELETTLMLPWQAALIVCLAILGYYLLVSLLPLNRLLRLPPAQLAAKYDL